MSQDLSFKSKEDLEFDEQLEQFFSRFSVKLACALFLDTLGLLIMFLIMDFSMSQYIFGFHIMSSIFAFFNLEDIRYPLRAIVGTFGIFLAIMSIHLIGSILAGIKTRKRPDIYFRQVISRYFDRVSEAKFKRH